jgi:hypothetical protein
LHVTELLGLYYLDTLGPAEGDLIEAHLPHCPPCREEADRVIDTVAALALLSEKDREEVLDTFGALNRSGPPSERFVRFFAPEEPDPPDPPAADAEPPPETRGPRRLPFGRRRAAQREPEPVNAPAVAPAPVAPPPVAPPPVAPRAVAPAATAPPARADSPPPTPVMVKAAPQIKPTQQIKPAREVTPASEVRPAREVIPAPEAKAAPEKKRAPEVEAASEVKAAPERKAEPALLEAEPLELPAGPPPSREELVREPGQRRLARRKPAEEKPASGPLPLAPAPPVVTPAAPPPRRDPVRPPRTRNPRRSALVRSAGLLALVLAIGGLALGALFHGDGKSGTAAVPVITAAATAADRATGATLSVFVTQQEAGVSVRATVDGLQAGAGYRLQAVTSDGHAWPVVNWTSDGKLQDITAEVRVPLSTLVFFTVSRAGSGPVVSAHLAPGSIRQE